MTLRAVLLWVLVFWLALAFAVNAWAATITGTDGPDTLHGTDFADVMYGYGGADTMRAHKGNDEVRGNGGNDYIAGGAGEDGLYGGAHNDTIDSIDNYRDTVICGDGSDDWAYADIRDFVSVTCENVTVIG